MKPPASAPVLHFRSLPRTLARTGAALLAALVVAVAAAPGTADAQRRAKRPPAATTAPAIGYADRPEVGAFVAEMVERHGFIETELRDMFAQVRRNDDAVRLMSPAPSGFKRSWQAYRSRFLDGLRIREGLRFWREHEPWLELAAQRFGVPPEIVVAIIGVETLYGRNTGDFRVLDVLTTLAFDYPRRADYFRSELEHYLLYSRESNLDVFAVRGSFAGAIGLPQFMPGSIRRFAVDLDGDGEIDLRSNPADAIGSVASFLAEHGSAAALAPFSYTHSVMAVVFGLLFFGQFPDAISMVGIVLIVATGVAMAVLRRIDARPIED